MAEPGSGSPPKSRFQSTLASCVLSVALAVGVGVGVVDAQTDPCVAVDNGTGTVTLPPQRCGYLSPDEVFMIIDGLPPGTTIELEPLLRGFSGPGPVPGGSLGGEVETFDATLVFRLRGTGALDGFERLLPITTAAVTHSAPRTPGDPVQSFATDLFALAGSVPPGDPDFATLQIVGGTSNGLPSPGHTTLSDLGDGTFLVDSFFDITYQIDFVGAPGGALDGLGGSTMGTVRMETRGDRNPCVVADDGTGTAELPPPGCEYMGLQQVHEIIDGLPAGTTIELAPRYRQFSCLPTGVCGTPGGSLGGEVEGFAAELMLQLEGTGALVDFRRTLRLPVQVETHSGPRTPGDPVQSFATDVANVQSTLVGDPDFASLEIVGGTSNGLPSPGHTTLTDLGDGTFQVDSFFDITYQVDFVGAPGSVLEGLSGSSQGRTTVRGQAGRGDAVEPDDGTGTATLPPEGSAYVGLVEPLLILDGLPPGAEIRSDPKLWLFFCSTIPCSQLGGTLGGTVEAFAASLDLELTGTGSLGGFRRSVRVPLAVETHSGPRLSVAMLGERGIALAPPQIFDADLYRLQGGLFGDPDFTELSVTAGTGNALPSPGHGTITDLGGGLYHIDSFFDVSYQIDFVGAPGGALEGLSGSTQGAVRLTAVREPSAPPHNVTIALASSPADGTDFSMSGGLGSFTLDDDANPILSSWRTFANLTPGAFTVSTALPPGWGLIRIACVDPDSGTTVDVASREAIIDLDIGEAITCTFETGLGLVFADGFESGTVARWSRSVGGS